MVSNLLLLVLWSEWCGGWAGGFNWGTRVLGDYRTAKNQKIAAFGSSYAFVGVVSF
jgi:hypothetical protein